jgi:hypothetical protein
MTEAAVRTTAEATCTVLRVILGLQQNMVLYSLYVLPSPTHQRPDCPEPAQRSSASAGT